MTQHFLAFYDFVYERNIRDAEHDRYDSDQGGGGGYCSNFFPDVTLVDIEHSGKNRYQYRT